MRKSVYIVFLLVAVFGLNACHKGEHEEMEAKSEPVMLNIKVSLSDLLPNTRALESEYAAAANDDEKIQTLRVIVVNSNNDVEGNVFLDLKEDLNESPKTEQTVIVKNVKSNDTKLIYLIVNEKATREVTTGEGTSREFLVNYDFSVDHIKPGLKFPTDEMFALRMYLKTNEDHLSNQLKGGIPMSEYHRVRIPIVPKEAKTHGDLLLSGEDGFFILDENDKPAGTDGEEIFGYRQTLWVTRTAVKFTYELTNKLTDSKAGTLKLLGVKMKKMARYAYFLPRVLEREGLHDIKEFVVPEETQDNDWYYDFEYECPQSLELPYDEQKVLEPIYLLEGKYTDKNEGIEPGWNYQAVLILEKDGVRVETNFMYLPNLPQLPRNTHVVIRATVNDPADIQWEVDVVPYGEVILEPDFGL